MKHLYDQALEAYLEMLSIHIAVKTIDPLFHDRTERFYETLFEIAHKVGERHVDLGGSLREDDLSARKTKALDMIRSLRESIETYAEDPKVSLGTQDLLGTLADDLENIEGDAKAFV